MKKLHAFYRVFRALSLDIVIGAVLVSMLIATLLVIEVQPIIYLTLAITVWLIYTWDHLSDAFNVVNPSSFRHQFHKRNKRFLIAFMIIGLMTGAVLVFFLPIQTVYYGVGAAALVFVYFLLVRFWDGFIYKEIISALLYSLGVFVGPLSLYEDFLSGFVVLMYFQILVIALMNLLIFSLFEDETDRSDGFISLIQLLGNKSKQVINILFFISLILTGFLLFIYQLPIKITSLFLVMSFVLVLINVNQDYFNQYDRYRILGDGIFYLPLLVLV